MRTEEGAAELLLRRGVLLDASLVGGLGWIVDVLLANCWWWLVGLVCSVILGFDAPRKEDGVQDNPAAKKRQPSYLVPFT